MTYWTNERISVLKDLADRGRPPSKIAAKMKISPDAVRHKLEDLGVKVQRPVEGGSSGLMAAALKTDQHDESWMMCRCGRPALVYATPPLRECAVCALNSRERRNT